MITEERFREIIKEELRNVIMIYLDAKSTANAIKYGGYYTVKDSKHAPSTSHSKPLPRKASLCS